MKYNDEVSTFAWYKAANATPYVGAGTYGTIQSSTSATSLAGLTFEFTLNAQNKAVKLHNGNTTTPKTEWYSPDVTTLNYADITSDYGDFYAYVDIIVAGVYLKTAYDTWYNGGGDPVGEKPASLGAAALQPYSGDYSFTVAPVTTGARDRGRISATEPEDAAGVCGMGTSPLAFKVTIVSDGSTASKTVVITNAVTNLNRFFVSVQGNDAVVATTAGEAEYASFTVSA